MLRAESKGAIGSFALDRTDLIPVFRTAWRCAGVLFVEHLNFALIAIETKERRMMCKKIIDTNRIITLKIITFLARKTTRPRPGTPTGARARTGTRTRPRTRTRAKNRNRNQDQEQARNRTKTNPKPKPEPEHGGPRRGRGARRRRSRGA